MEPKPLTSAFESPTFNEDSSFYVDQPVGSMSISPCGRDVVLASKEGLHVIDLDSPYSPPRYLPHHTPWEVADVQWSPFGARDYWVVSTSNQKALVWNLAVKSGQNPIEHVLHAHSRAITDINFSAHHPDILATCSVDSFVHSWDLRVPYRPVISFSDWFAGATQVKWNRQDSHVIASSHDKFLRIWDDRMGAYPIKSIEAHSTKIYGVDWNRVRPDALLTCSLDKTIKFWNYTAEGEVPEKLIHTPFPVWRARNTPFAWGVLAMPQRGNSDLHLYSRRAGEGSNPEENLPLVHSFPGHKGQVKEFLWRSRGGVEDGIDNRDFQLVSWGTDKELRLHRVNPETLQGVGYEKGKSFVSTMNVTRRGSVYKTFRDESDQEFDDTESALSSNPNMFRGGVGMNTISVPYGPAFTQKNYVDSRVGMQGKSNIRTDTNPISWMRGVKVSSGWDIETLENEITHIGDQFTKVIFESIDVKQRIATISLHGPWGAEGSSLFLKVDIKFPQNYPRAAAPSFNVQRTAAVTDQLASKIVLELRQISETYLTFKRGCLEGVVRYLLGECTMEEITSLVVRESGDESRGPVNGEFGSDESSDEDDVGMSRSQDLMMSTELPPPINANVMVPVARKCGAVWANDGRLVCFFPPKKDEASLFLDALGFKDVSRLSRSDRVFEGLGHLQTSSPERPMASTVESTEDGASEFSDDSYTESSSSSSGSSDLLPGLPPRLPGSTTWRSGASMGIHRVRSADNWSGPGAFATNKSSEGAHSIVSIHDLNDLLPTKRELASRYRICGNGIDVCAHNGTVASEVGCHDIAHVWRLVRQILLDYPFNGLNGSTPPGRGGQAPLRKKDSGVDLSYDIKQNDDTGNIYTQWGGHPFGGRWLIPALFSHFESDGNIQMVAMLACVLHQASPRNKPTKLTTSKSQEKKSSPSGQYAVPLVQDRPQFQSTLPSPSPQRDDRTTMAAAERSPAELSRTDSTSSFPAIKTAPLSSRPGGFASERKPQSQNVSMSASPDQQSQVRSGSILGSVIASSFSRSFKFGPSSSSPPADTLNKQDASQRSDSPNGTAGHGWTSSGNPTDSGASSIQVFSHRPRSIDPEAAKEGGQKPRKGPSKFKVTVKNKERFDDETKPYRLFSEVPFLDPQKGWLYWLYCTAYADMLAMWDLPVSQGEVRKIGAILECPADIHKCPPDCPPGESLCLPPSRIRASKATFAEMDNEALDIQPHCVRCSHDLQMSIFAMPTPPPPKKASSSERQANLDKTRSSEKISISTRERVSGERVSSSERSPAIEQPSWCLKCASPCRLQPPKPPCVICGEVVDGMLVPCLSCGHVLCYDCNRSWFLADADSEVSEGNTPPTCPTGCGCNCSKHAVMEAPVSCSPPLLLAEAKSEDKSESSSIYVGHGYNNERSYNSSEKGSSQHVLQSGGGSSVVHHGPDDPVDQLAGWYTSNFASLAKGLGGGLSRGLPRRNDNNTLLNVDVDRRYMDRKEFR